MYESGELETAGRSALGAFLAQREWVHRRVEAVTFPARNDPIIRRRVSIDFSIPAGLAAVEDHPDEGVDFYYVPVSVLRKWPPVLQMDMRDEQDEAIPLLTRNQNGVADTALLIARAEQCLEGGTLPASMKDLLSTIAIRPGEQARDALTTILPPHGTDDHVQAKLRNDPAFLDLVGGLVDNTLLWLRVGGAVGQRKIVKFAYDVDRELNVKAWDAAAFGYAPLQARVFTPHIGSSGSYHLAVACPSPLDIVDAEITIRERITPLHNLDEGDVIARCTSEQSASEGPLEPPMRDLTLYAGAVGGQARFYISGDREGCFGRLFISIAVRKRGFLSGSAIASCLLAALLLAYAALFGTVSQHPGRMTPVLLLVPALLAYLVVRPNDHGLAREFLSGTRNALLLAGVLPIAAAATLALGGSATWVHVAAWLIAIVATCVAGILGMGVVLPWGKQRMPLSSSTDPAG